MMPVEVECTIDRLTLAQRGTTMRAPSGAHAPVGFLS